jgi:hypothetical protein
MLFHSSTGTVRTTKLKACLYFNSPVSNSWLRLTLNNAVVAANPQAQSVNRVQAVFAQAPLRPFAGLAQEQEPGVRGGEARGGGRLGALTPPTGLGLLTVQADPRRDSPRSGSAWLGRSQKVGLPSARGRGKIPGSRPSTRARGAAWSLPLSTPMRGGIAS